MIEFGKYLATMFITGKIVQIFYRNFFINIIWKFINFFGKFFSQNFFYKFLFRKFFSKKETNSFQIDWNGWKLVEMGWSWGRLKFFITVGWNFWSGLRLINGHLPTKETNP